MKRIGIFTSLNYPVCEEVDAVLCKILDKRQLSGVDTNEYYMMLHFGDNVAVRIWNTNRWYGWMMRGEVSIGDVSIFKWNECRPRRRTMNVIIKKVSCFLKNKIDSMI